MRQLERNRANCYNPSIRTGGIFPDLTRCAEDRLRTLKPQSKLFRTEEILIKKEHLTPSEWKEANDPVMDWIGQIQKKDKLLSRISENENDDILYCPPIRVTGKKIECKNENIANNKKENRIKATEYSKWDKYDADTEALKIDLDEERAKEEVERMNKINLKKSKDLPDIISDEKVDKYTIVEKEALALQFKDRGNDYYRSKEYSEAVREYSQCIQILPSATAYNNRAMCYLKLQNYKKSLEDCDSCLQIEPDNKKALLRKGQALLGLDNKNEAYEVYKKIVSIDPSNTTAQNNINDLKKQLGDIAPKTATRISIIEEDSTSTKEQKHTKTIVSTPTTTKQYIDEDLSQLIMPKKIIKNKLTSAVEKLGNMQKLQNIKSEKVSKNKCKEAQTPEVTLLTNRINNENKVLIQEITD